jgi:hypothetical protein
MPPVDMSVEDNALVTVAEVESTLCSVQTSRTGNDVQEPYRTGRSAVGMSVETVIGRLAQGTLLEKL